MSSDITSIESQFNITRANSNSGKVYELEGFRLNAALLLLYKARQPVELAPKVVKLCSRLIERRGEVAVKNELMNRL